MRGAVLFALVAVVAANGFDYVDQDKWGDHYEFCGAAVANQSPIDLFTGMKGEEATTGAGPLKLQLTNAASGTWENSGHTLQFSFDAGSQVGTTGNLPVSGLTKGPFSFQQLHFHSPAEHVVDGVQYPLEVHFVAKNADGELAVVSAFWQVTEDNKPNPQIQSLFEAIPIVGAKKAVSNFDLNGLVPGGNFFSYMGSTTTPPCVQNVAWNIFKNPMELSQAQLDRFNKFYRGNNRDLQSLDGRVTILNAVLEKTDQQPPDLTQEFEMPKYDDPMPPPRSE